MTYQTNRPIERRVQQQSNRPAAPVGADRKAVKKLPSSVVTPDGADVVDLSTSDDEATCRQRQVNQSKVIDTYRRVCDRLDM